MQAGTWLGDQYWTFAATLNPLSQQQHNKQIVRIISQMMVADQRFSLRWNNYQSQMVKAFENLLDESDFVDVTLGVEGKKLSAHKMLLSACSPYFRELLKV